MTAVSCHASAIKLMMCIRKLQKTYEASLDVMKHVGQVVESLYVKAQKLR